MLEVGMRERGCNVEVWSPSPFFHNLSIISPLKKWFGYIDQFILFPWKVKRRLKSCAPNTIFVFTDQALGPWVPLVKDRHHVIHCHDFLAQRSALGEFVENPTGLTGRLYQWYIRRGYLKGKNFISISKKTKEDLHRFLTKKPLMSKVVYNGLNQKFEPLPVRIVRSILSKTLGLQLNTGYLLHIGGNQWYKNRIGVIEIYNAWRGGSRKKLPLLLIGETPGKALLKAHSNSPFKKDIQLVSDIDDEMVRKAYAGASAFIFPSIAEGFGWPIAEAMACGCPVITTGEAPMSEVAGDAGFFIPVRPNNSTEILRWSQDAAEVVNKVISLSPQEREKYVEDCILNAQRFNQSEALDKIYSIYLEIVQRRSHITVHHQ
jgi:glycosyltransferase involved in cell wall biosynthesis